MCICAMLPNGDQGHVIIEPGPLGKIREKEAENAGKFIGAKEVFNINVSDMQVNPPRSGAD